MPSLVSFSHFTPQSNSEITCPVCYLNQNESTETWIAHSKFHPAHEQCLKDWFKVSPICPSCYASVKLSLKERVIIHLPFITGTGMAILSGFGVMFHSGVMPFIEAEYWPSTLACLFTGVAIRSIAEVFQAAISLGDRHPEQLINQLCWFPINLNIAAGVGYLVGIGLGAIQGIGARIYFYDHTFFNSDLSSIDLTAKLSIGVATISLLGFGGCQLYRIITETTERITKRVFQSMLINYELLHGN